EQLALLRIDEGSPMSGTHREDADLVSRPSQEEEPRAREWQRVRVLPGWGAAAPDPVDDSGVFRVELVGLSARLPSGEGELAFGPRQEDADVGFEGLADVLRGDPHERIGRRGRGELATHRVEARRPILALARRQRLVANPLREAADDDRDAEHDGE